MASIRRASGPAGLGSSASQVASMKAEASAKAGSIGARGMPGFISTLQFHRLGPFDALRSKNDFLKPRFRAFELFFAMRLQRCAALIEGDGIFQVDLALFEPGNDVLQFSERRFETQILDCRRRSLIRRH